MKPFGRIIRVWKAFLPFMAEGDVWVMWAKCREKYILLIAVFAFSLPLVNAVFP